MQIVKTRIFFHAQNSGWRRQEGQTNESKKWFICLWRVVTWNPLIILSSRELSKITWIINLHVFFFVVNFPQVKSIEMTQSHKFHTFSQTLQRERREGERERGRKKLWNLLNNYSIYQWSIWNGSGLEHKCIVMTLFMCVDVHIKQFIMVSNGKHKVQESHSDHKWLNKTNNPKFHSDGTKYFGIKTFCFAIKLNYYADSCSLVVVCACVSVGFSK